MTRFKPPRRARQIDSTAMTWLGHDTRSAGVLATARLHLQLQQALSEVLPPVLASACRVCKLDGQRLQLAVPTPAHAAKLRQLGPSMGKSLSARGWNLNTIDVIVSGGLQTLGERPGPAPKEAVPLDTASLQAFSELHDALRPGPLAQAVARLLRHHKPA